MAETVGLLLALASMVGGLVALVCLVRPSRRLRLPTRKAAGVALIASLVGFGVGGSLLPPPTPEQLAARHAERERKRMEREREDSLEREAATAKTERAAAADKQRSLAKQNEERALVLALWSNVIDTASACDEANTKVVNSLSALQKGRSSVYDAYELASGGQDICRSSHQALRRLDSPKLANGNLTSEFDGVLDRCADAYLARQLSLGQLQEVLDGDYRPSVVNIFKQSTEAAQIGVLACIAGFMSNAGKLGIEPKELKTS